MLVVALITGSLLFVTVILTNVVQTLSLVLLPFSRAAFRRVNREAANAWWALCVIWAENVQRVRPVITGDTLPNGENAFVIANHQSMPDIVALMMLAYRKRRLGDMKWFVKDAIKYVPGIGWGMLYLDCIFLKRDWDRDADKIQATFAKFLSDQIPVWMMSFPEGTRLTPAKLVLAQDFARKSGRPLPQHVLIPRTRGFTATVLGMRTHLGAIYDVTIAYPGKAPTMTELLGQIGGALHLHVRRYEISALPKEPDEISAWLVERFREKDALMEHFAKHGSFVTPQ
jgi:1-acyl-sn-glycerol-3-phosphate acyltransferase